MKQKNSIKKIEPLSQKIPKNSRLTINTQDFFILIFIIAFQMSFAMCLEAMEMVGSMVVTAKEVQIQVLKSKIKNLVSQHEQQFKAISNIHNILNKFYTDPMLIQNLHQTSFVLYSSWKNIASDLKQKVSLINQLTKPQSNQNTSAYDFSFKDGYILSIGTLLTAYQLYSYSKKYGGSAQQKKITPQNLGQQLRDGLGRQQIRMVQLNTPESTPTQPSEEIIQMQTSFTTPREDIQGVKQFSVSSSKIQVSLQAPSKSLWTKLKVFGSKIGKGLMKGLRIIGILGIIYMVVMQQKQIDQLIDKYRSLYDEYGEDGSFKDKEISIINLILSFGQLVSNLSYATFGCFQQISNLYLMMSLIQTQSNAQLLAKSQQMYPNFYPFCQASNTLFKSLTQIKVSCNSDYKTLRAALNTSCTLLTDFNNNNKPAQTFQNFSLKLNNYLIKDLFFAKDLLVYQTNLRNFQIIQRNEFRDRKKYLQQKKEEKTPTQKIRQYDQGFILNFINNYISLKQKIGMKVPVDKVSQYSYLLEIDSSFLRQIGNVIASYTKEVYSEPDNKLFNIPFSQYQGSNSYQEILDDNFNYPNTITIPFSEEKQRSKYINEFQVMIKKSISQNKVPNYFDQTKYVILEKIPAMVYTVLLDQFKINKTSYNKMKFVKALFYKVVKDKKSKQSVIFRNDDGNLLFEVVPLKA